MRGHETRRTGKKRRLAELLAAMYRLDAIFPQRAALDLDFTTLILLVRALRARGNEDPGSRRFLYELFQPQLKLRRDDIEFVSSKLAAQPLDIPHVDWLLGFSASIAETADRTAVAGRLDRMADAASALTPADSDALREVARQLAGPHEVK